MSVQLESVAVPSPDRRPTRSRRRRLLLLASVAAVLALVGASCRQLDPNNRAAAVPGVTNGYLPMAYLASTSSGCVVYDEALGSLKAMIAQAAKDGVALKPLSCYRDYAGQVAARADWCARGACQMAAVPGTSNHGWGKAVDFRDQTGELTFDSPGYLWMMTWAGYYGWIHPKGMEQDGPVPEAWHWEWIGDGGKMFPGEYFGIGNTPPATPRGMPFGAVDSVTGVPGGVKVGGWAIDPDQAAPVPVHIYVDATVYGVLANTRRPDVNDAFPWYAAFQHGFSTTVAAASGPHTVCVYVINMSGTGSNRLLSCATVTVPSLSGPAEAPSTTTTTAPVAPTTTSTAPVAPTTVTTGAATQALTSGTR
jgi:hypothetical protein